ncbi:MAG: SDR family oxidoreductase [Hahellaceae bacterium]|nr:SDR family oxidoreductase [Hahellaceae bacterium]
MNCAASVNFREPLDQALAINIASVLSMTSLAARFNLPLVHVSTCYVHGLHQGEIREELHQPLKGIVTDGEGNYPIEALLEKMRKDIEQVRAAVKETEVEGVLGIFPPKSTLRLKSHAPLGFPRTITFPEQACIRQSTPSIPPDLAIFRSVQSYRCPSG